MTARAPDPRRLDIAALAAASQAIKGRSPLAAFDRLAQTLFTQQGDLSWSARGELRPVGDGDAQCWLHLAAQASVQLECQRCLQAVGVPLDLSRSLRFVETEDEAAALDAESEDDVLERPRRLDLHDLLEDEVLLALPLVPMHDSCPEPLRNNAGTPEGEATAHPFAVLHTLARRRGS